MKFQLLGQRLTVFLSLCKNGQKKNPLTAVKPLEG